MENNVKNCIEELGKSLEKEAVQRTKGAETKKGYDTTGYGYQYCINRFNKVLGEKWGFVYNILREGVGSYKSGQPFYDITVEVGIWINDKDNIRFCAGGHISGLHFDALKGAITNAFKKTSAFWGVGKEAYEGTIDDDNKPLPDSQANIETTSKSQSINIEVCHFGKHNGKKWKDMDTKQIVWYIEYFDKKVNEGGQYKESNQATLEYLLTIRDEQNSEGGE